MIDIIEKCHGSVQPTINCLDHGHVKLIDCSPRLIDEYDCERLDKINCEHRILDAARQSVLSNKAKEHSADEDRGLIRYLMRHRHTSPFEFCEFTFHHKLPIFVARQLIRHRTANVNEMSGRYSKLPNEFYIPHTAEVRAQSKTNKQGSEGTITDSVSMDFVEWLLEQKQDYKDYEHFLNQGVSKEMARCGLSVNLYTEWYWKIDLHNLLHFLSLRCDKHAQYEIRVYADAMLSLITPLVPRVIEAWNDFHPSRGAMLLTKLEVEAVKTLFTAGLSERATTRERIEWEEKKKLLFPEVKLDGYFEGVNHD